MPDALLDRLRLTMEIAELEVEKLRTKLAHRLKRAEMEVRTAADEADAAQKKYEVVMKGDDPERGFYRETSLWNRRRSKLEWELATLELDRARRELASELAFSASCVDGK